MLSSIKKKKKKTKKLLKWRIRLCCNNLAICLVSLQKVLCDYAGLFYVPMAAHLMNEETTKCRKLTALALKSLIQKVNYLRCRWHTVYHNKTKQYKMLVTETARPTPKFAWYVHSKLSKFFRKVTYASYSKSATQKNI